MFSPSLAHYAMGYPELLMSYTDTNTAGSYLREKEETEEVEHMLTKKRREKKQHIGNLAYRSVNNI